MYSQYAAEYVKAEANYRAEQVRRGLKPSRRRAKALFDAETRAMASRR